MWGQGPALYKHNYLKKITVQNGALEFKGSHSMGDGRIFLKSRRDVSFKKGLSNELLSA